MKVTKKQVKDKLKEVLDPELGISIVDMGFIYNIDISDKKVKVTMTLTTIGCPLFTSIEDDVKNKIKELGIKHVDVDLTFEPPWSIDKMSKSARKRLGF